MKPPEGAAAQEAGPEANPAGLFEPAELPDRQPQQSSRISSPSVVEALAPSRYKVQFTASGELRDKLTRLQALMRSELPGGDLSAVIDRAVTETLERLEARRYAKTAAPRPTHAAPPHSRHIPAAIRRAVHERDGGRCRYLDAAGSRCPERNVLEYHHLHPFGMGGEHTLENLRLMCRTHNLHLAEHDYGRKAMAAYRRLPGGSVLAPTPG